MSFPLPGRAALAPRLDNRSPRRPLMHRRATTLALLLMLTAALWMLLSAYRDAQQKPAAISPQPDPTPAPTPKVIFRTPDETRVRSLEMIAI